MMHKLRIRHGPLISLCAGLAVLTANAAVAALKLDLEARGTRLGGLYIAHIEARQGDGADVRLAGITHAAAGPLGDLLVGCPAGPAVRCGDGTLHWHRPSGESMEWRFVRSSHALRFDGRGRVDVQWPDRRSVMLDVQGLDPGLVPEGIRQAAGLSTLAGQIDGMFRYANGAMHANIEIGNLEFDSPDGRFAGAGIGLELDLDWQPSDAAMRVQSRWNAGEFLLGPVYLPPPGHPVALNLAATRLPDAAWRVDQARLAGRDMFDLQLAGRLELGQGLSIENMDVELAYADLQSLWRQGLASLAGAQGWGQLRPTGRLQGRMRVEHNAVASLGMQLSEAGIEDGAERIGISDLGAWVEWEADRKSLAANADWSGARLFRIPLGAAAVGVNSAGDGVLELTAPLRLPLLDGALVLEQLKWRDWTSARRQLDVDARLEPVDLGRLTRTLGWTEFGGQISGRFPGIRLSGNAIGVQGGLDLDLFGGTARVQHLSVERPFGTLPALAADIEFDALDLDQVTGAFEFGRMQGLLSGHVDNLRLLDWRPVAFDAWFETLDDSPGRRISQQAVDSISTISGGGAAALSGPLLGIFDDFPYRKAGLGCSLRNNVCHMRGLRDSDSAGYLILEGRSLPRLDIIGYQRRVDWPRLLSQLAAATAGSE